MAQSRGMPAGKQSGVNGENPRPLRPKTKGAVGLIQKVLVWLSVKELRRLLANAGGTFAYNTNS